MPHIGRRDLVLLLIGAGPEGGADDEVGGLTRLQKYLYLLEREAAIKPAGDGFEFAAYKAGPYSSKLYDDLEFLENLGLLATDFAAEATEAEAAEVDLLSFDSLIGDDADVGSNGERTDGARAADVYEERRFRLTEAGRQKVEELLAHGETRALADGIRRIKSRFANHSLNDLLYYVYTKYPDMATESEIRDKVLSRRRQ